MYFHGIIEQAFTDETDGLLSQFDKYTINS